MDTVVFWIPAIGFLNLSSKRILFAQELSVQALRPLSKLLCLRLKDKGLAFYTLKDRDETLRVCSVCVSSPWPFFKKSICMSLISRIWLPCPCFRYDFVPKQRNYINRVVRPALIGLIWMYCIHPQIWHFPVVAIHHITDMLHSTHTHTFVSVRRGAFISLFLNLIIIRQRIGGKLECNAADVKG